MSKVPEFEKVKCETPDLAKENLEKLKAHFPDVVTEGPDGVAIDVEALIWCIMPMNRFVHYH